MRKAIKFDSNSKSVIAELASAYYDLRRYPQSREYYLKLVNMGETSAENYRQVVQLSFNLRQFDDVILYADKWKKVDPAAQTSFYLGKIHYDRENYGEAIRMLNYAIKEDPTNAEAPYMIARSYAT